MHRTCIMAELTDQPHVLKYVVVPWLLHSITESLWSHERLCLEVLACQQRCASEGTGKDTEARRHTALRGCGVAGGPGRERAREAHLGDRPLARRARGLQHKHARVPRGLPVRVPPLVRRAIQVPCAAAAHPGICRKGCSSKLEYDLA